MLTRESRPDRNNVEPGSHGCAARVGRARKRFPAPPIRPPPAHKGTKIVPEHPKQEKCAAVQVNGLLGAARLDTAREVELCIPSVATLP